MGYVDESKGNRGASIEQYALGFIRDIAAAHLSKERIQSILGQFSDRKIWNSANYIQSFVPLIVREVIDSGKLTAPQFVARIHDRVAFKAFADHKKTNSKFKSA